MFNFLNTKFNFFGLDVSDNFLRVASVKKNKNGLFLVSYGEKEINFNLTNKGNKKDEDLLAEEIKTLIKNVNGEKIRTKYVAIALPEEKSFFQIIKMPKMDDDELKKSVIYEAENYVPLSIDDVYLDFQIISSNKDFLEILISAVPKKTIDFNISLVEKAGFFPVVIEPAPISIIRSIINKENTNEPILSVNIQESKSTFIIFFENSIRFTTSINSSLENFNKEIFNNDVIFSDNKELEIISKADKKNENSDSFKFFLNEILKLTDRCLSYSALSNFASEPKEKKGTIKKIIISGKGANLKGLDHFFSKKFRIETEIGYPLVNYPENSKEKYKNGLLGYETSIGLALRNFDSKNLL